VTPEDLRALFEYEEWANDRTLKACATLTPDQFTRNLGSSFSSVRDTLFHIAGAQWIWSERLRGRSPAAPFDSPGAYRDVDALRALWDKVERPLIAHIQTLSAADLGTVLEYRTLGGQESRSPMWQVLQHLANHGTYHRGQVTTLLRQLGAKPVSTDLIAFYRARAVSTK
jgi:uncharacterized damage-inducible protein DinB